MVVLVAFKVDEVDGSRVDHNILVILRLADDDVEDTTERLVELRLLLVEVDGTGGTEYAADVV